METLLGLVTDPLVWIGVALTIIAWSRGWRGWALVPMAAWVPLCYVTGVVLRSVIAPEALEDIAGPAAVLLFIALCLALVAMILFPRRNKSGRELATNASTVGTSSFCPKCGREQHGTPLFCRDCGHRLGGGRV